MTARTFAASLSASTTALGEAVSRETPDGLRTSGVSRELLLGVLTAWGERVANGTMSVTTYAAKAVAITNRTEVSHV